MEIKSEIFILNRKKNEYIVYAPLKGIIMLVDEYAKNQFEKKNVTDKLMERDLLSINFDKEDTPPKPQTTDFYNRITIFLTFDCNLRCRYCYANAGMRKDTMTRERIVGITDFFLSHLKKNNWKDASVTFHGGGEPTYKWDLFVWTYNYIKRKLNESGIKLHTSISTNLFLSEEKAKWLANNIDSIQISFDGMKVIQDYQRPAVENKPTFDIIFRNIKLFDKMKKHYAIRTTVTPYSLDKMIENFHFIVKNFKYMNSLQFELVQMAGRGENMKLNRELVDKYVENIKKIYDMSVSEKINLIIPEVDIKRITSHYCGAYGSNRVFLPSGYITTCYGIDYKKDPKSKLFFIGKYNGNKVDLDDNKLLTLSTRNIYNIKKCKNCFIKYHCAGDCSLKSDDIFNPDNLFVCEQNKKIGFFILNRIIENKKCINIKYKRLPKLSKHILKIIRITK